MFINMPQTCPYFSYKQAIKTNSNTGDSRIHSGIVVCHTDFAKYTVE